MACCGVPAWAQTAPTPTPHVPLATDTIQEGRHGNVAVTQKDALRTGEDKANGKPPTVYHLLGFGLSGTHRINTDALIATLPQHKGDVITSADINADVDKIHQALKAAHVHGDMTTATMEKEGPGHWVWIIWDVHLMDALTGTPQRGPRHFESQIFTGNTKLNDAALVEATDLHTGEILEDGRISDARTGIEQAYDKVLPGADVQARAKITVKKDSSVSINWIIKEPK
jgi:outer membrane protein assembly factor BamA